MKAHWISLHCLTSNFWKCTDKLITDISPNPDIHSVTGSKQLSEPYKLGLSP